MPEPRTATLLSLALFPPVFLFQRVMEADVVFVLSNRRSDDDSHPNQCVIRPAFGQTRKIEIPVLSKAVPIDEVPVPEPSIWLPQIQRELQRAYKNLPMASAASELLLQSMPPYSSPWLTDYLMHAFVMTLRALGWEKEIIRGDTLQRRCYDADHWYLLELCLQNRCKRLLIGNGPELRYRELFRSYGVTLVRQDWRGSPTLPVRDSILDAIARLSPTQILNVMQEN